MSVTQIPDIDQAFGLLRVMHRIRAFEQCATRLMAQGVLEGFLHVSIGQEAVAAGVCSVLERNDLMTTSHRGHGHCIAKGARIPAMMAELFGRSGGYCGGRSGSMHIADAEVGILGANAIVGAGIPIAAGGALASQVRGTGQVAVCFFGDGAVAEGVFHETLNISALWSLPVVFVCENNQYAEMTPSQVHLATTVVAEYARPYGLPSVTVDGNDVLAVRAAAEEAVHRARGGLGPSLVECLTYRWHGHFEGDSQRYRDKAEVAEWMLKDPIEHLAAWILSRDHRLQERIALTRLEAVEEVEQAVAWASALPVPGPEALLADVYAEDLLSEPELAVPTTGTGGGRG
jgi:TPP-dependent pyruvate/acetoin dehydrogenase alpha subunit